MTKDYFKARLIGFLGLLPLSSCMYMSQPGPTKSSFEEGSAAYELISVNSRADLPSAGRTYGMGEIPPAFKGGGYSDRIRTRDTISFIITDLDENSPFHTAGQAYSYGPLEVPEDGNVTVPYIGEIDVNNRKLSEVAAELNERAKPVSNTAQVSVSRSGRIPRTANVVGEVKNPGPVPLERADISSLDLLAASGGPVETEHLFRYTLRRQGRDYVFDYLGFRQRPFPVEEGDLLSVSTDTSNRFYVMGAINKPTTVGFPVAAPTLADGLGAAFGLDERRSDPSGIFVFRKGNPDKVYTFDLNDPAIMLLTQRFPLKGEDIVYITEAPLARWNRLISQTLPFSQAVQNANRIGSF